LEESKPTSRIRHQIRVTRRLRLVAASPILLLLVSCSHPSAISRDELHSIVRSSVSFASEAVMLVDCLEEGRTTSSFSSGHFHYMADELKQRARRLEQSKTTPHNERAVEESRQNVEALASLLTVAASETSNRFELLSAKKKILMIRQALEKTSGSL
jgi:hypothetical protein